MSLFQNRTKSDLFYLEVFSLVYKVMSDDIINGPIIGTDAGGIGFNRTKQFIDSGKDTPGEDLKSLYLKIIISLGNKPSLLEEDFKSRNDRIYFGWLYDQNSSDIKNYLREFFSALEYPEEESPEPEIVPNDGEEEVPVYIVRSSVPGGLRGQIYFEFRDGLDGQRELGGIGEIFQDSYNTEEVIFSSVGESSTDFNYRDMGNSILQQLNNQIQEIDGVEQFGVLSIVETQTEPPQNFYNYTIIGKVVDGLSKEPLGDVYITDDVKSVGLIGSNINSESTGEFKLDGEYLKEKTFKLTFSLNGYITRTFNPFESSNSGIKILRKDIGIIELYSTIPSKQATIVEMPYTDIQLQTITTQEKLKDPGGFFTDAMLQQAVKTLKTTLLPFALAQIAKFGITNAKEAFEKGVENINVSCPANLDILNQIIADKNKLTKQLNNLFQSLERIKVGVEIADKIISAANIAAQTLSAIAIALPTVPFAPPLAGPITTKIPTKNGPKDVIQIIAEVLGKLKIASSSVLLILNILIQIIQTVLNYLSLLDGLIQKCAIDGALPQESLSNDLLLATQGQAEQGSPVVTNVNGFEMGVITVEGTTNDQLKRRQAVARNKAGITMLKGEPSFSSNDQILIDELVFYIKQNNLKAD